MNEQSLWGYWAEVTTVLAFLVALLSWLTARKSQKTANESLEVAKEARDIAKKEFNAKVDEFEVRLLDSKRIKDKDNLVAIYIELVNKSALPSSLTNFTVSAHMHFHDDSQQEIEIEEYKSKDVSSNIWTHETQFNFPLYFNERQARKGYIVARLPNLKTELDYVKKLTLTMVSSQNKSYIINCYGL